MVKDWGFFREPTPERRYELVLGQEALARRAGGQLVQYAAEGELPAELFAACIRTGRFLQDSSLSPDTEVGIPLYIQPWQK